MTVHAPETDSFEHIALLYRDTTQYARGCSAFVRRGLDAGDPVMIAVPGANGSIIRSALGADAAGVRFADMAQAGRNPGRIIPWVLMEFARNHPGRRVWIIGEPIWPARSEVEYPACAAHEALTNVAFTGRDAAILCPYDVAGLNEQRVSDSWRTHPVMADADRSWVSDRYADPVDVAASFNQPLPAPPATAQRLSFARLPDLAALRALVTWHATESRLPLARTVDLLLAVQELAVNTIEHANIGDGTLMVWSEPGMVICQIEDRGHITDPMAGCRRPENRFQRGQGLVRVNRLVDFLRCHTDFSGTAFRLHMHLPTHP